MSKVVTASFQFNGQAMTGVPVLNPGDWFGKTWLIEIGGCAWPSYIIVEADSVSDAIDELADSEKWGEFVRVPESDLGDYPEESRTYAGNAGEVVDLDNVMVYGAEVVRHGAAMPFPCVYHCEGAPAEGVSPLGFDIDNPAKLPEPGDYCEANGAEWESQHLKEYGEYSDAIEYVNQADDYGDSLRGEWFASDDRTRTIYHGSFGNDHSPGASHYTNAEVFATEEEYRAKLAEWEALPEYLPTDDEDAEDDTDEDEEADEPQEGDYTTADHRKWFQYGRLVLDLAEDADHLKALAEHMKAGNYYPSVWFISDHGNAHRIDWILND